MKKLIFVFLMLASIIYVNAQNHSDYVYNFSLPGTYGSSLNFRPLDDSVAVIKAKGWNLLVMGYYNLSHYNNANEYKAIIEPFELMDSARRRLHLRRSVAMALP
jgi:hypothetical protein